MPFSACRDLSGFQNLKGLPVEIGQHVVYIFVRGENRIEDLLDPAAVGVLNSAGNHGWSGWASTNFWVDPVEEMVGLIMVQYIPQNDYLLGVDFRTAVYQALV